MVRREKRKGFTLVEIMLVILIVAFLGTVTTVLVLKQREGSKIDMTRILVTDTIPKQLELYNSNIGHYPTDEEGGLQALLVKPSFQDDKTGEKWRGPYVTAEQLKDAWGNDIKFQLVDDTSSGANSSGGTTTTQVPHIWSFGPNGTDDNGQGDDICNWSTDTTK